MSAPAIGSIWRSGDPRDDGRLVTIEAISESGDFAYVRRVTSYRKRRRSRIHVSRFDGKQWQRISR